MSVQVEKLEAKDMVKLTIEVPAEDFAKACQDSYNKQKKDISIPGFRKGKVPMVMVEKMYGAGIFYEDAANALIPIAYSDAAKESGLDIVSRPEIEVTQIEKGKPFIFTAEVATKPEVTLGDYKGIEITKIDCTVTDEDIEKEIQSELKKNARQVSVEREIAEGDTAVIDYVGSVDGVEFDGGKAENHQLKIGSGQFIPGFEDQLIGKKAGEDVEVNVTFPEEYHAPELAGKAAVFAVKINEVKAEELPEFDEDFVQDVSEFDTVEEYKADLATKLENNKKNVAKSTQQQEALDKATANATVELPDAMVDSRCEDQINQFANQLAQQGMPFEQYMQMTGGSIDDLKEQLRPETVERISQELVLEAIAKAENIEVSDEDVDAEIAKMAEMYKMEVEQLKGYMGEAERENMKGDMMYSKALDFLMENAVEVEAAAE